MDRDRFDELAKSAASGTRRSLLKVSVGAAVGGAIGLVGIKSASAARKRANGGVCRFDTDCESNFCGSWDYKHNRGICEDDCEYQND